MKNNYRSIPLVDYGPEPFVVNIHNAAMQNQNYRTALWTGNNAQLTLMSINVGEDVGLENHSDIDQFLTIVDGLGLVQMGMRPEKLNYRSRIEPGNMIIVPAGTWHNITNIGNRAIKIYSVYAPVKHPYGTVQETKIPAE